ncbi:MAG TPA: arsenite methyltransferase [Anaerolineales bacterium]|nr:arsenite methyltransferase [Anaerolineales bacterium]
MNESPEVIRQTVREHYGQLAESAGPCCGPAACSCHGYSDDELALLPTEATSISLGCGNPTALASLREGEVVLDLGSGGGLDALLASRRVGPTGRVFGVDMTPEMIDLARRNAARAGVENVEFLPGDLEDLPVPAATIDVIISNCVVNLTPDKGRALQEAFRVLRPGGRLAISDIVIDPDLTGLPLPEDEIRHDLDWAGCAAGALTTAEWRSTLARAGFVDIDLTLGSRLTVESLVDDDLSLTRQADPAVLAEVARRFTSTSISARKPT